MYLDKAKNLIKEINPKLETHFVGVSKSDVKVLEAILQTKLPLAFKEFLEWFGQSGGNLMVGSDFYFAFLSGIAYSNERRWGQNASLKKFAIDLLNENNLNGTEVLKDAIVFCMHQGYTFLYINANEGNDPPVYSYLEGQKATSKNADSFSEFIEDLLATEGNPRENLLVFEIEDIDNIYSYDDRIRHLSFNGNIKSENGYIPPRVFDFINLEQLDLRYFNLIEIDSRIKVFSKLKYLNLCNNKIDKIDKALFELQHLETLYLNDNKLKSVPEEIRYCQNLKAVYLANNYLGEKELAKLQNWLPQVTFM